MPPLKGEGDREAVEGCAPGANVFHSTTYPRTAKPPGTNPWGPCVRLYKCLELTQHQ